MDPGQRLRPQADPLGPDLQVHDAIHRVARDDPHAGTGDESEFPPATKPFRVGVLDLADDDALASGELGDRPQSPAGEAPVRGRDRVMAITTNSSISVNADRRS